MGLLLYHLQYIDFSDLYETLDAVRRVARRDPNEENVDTDLNLLTNVVTASAGL